MIYLEDTFLDHPKMVGAGDDGVMMWVRGISWLKQQRSPTGRIPKAVVTARLAPIVGGKALAPGPIMQRLIKVGSWHDDGDYVLVHGYVERNEASIQRSEIARGKAEKRWAKERARREAHANGDARTDAPAHAAAMPQQMPVAMPGADATVHSPQSTVPTDVVTPSLTTMLEAPEAEGGSGYAENDHPFDPDDGPTPDDLAATRRTEPPGLRKIDAALRQVCPPDKNRLYGSPRSDLIAALRAGGDVDLIVAAVKQGDPNEGAFIRANRAIAALRDGKVPTGVGGSPVKPYQTPTWEDDPPTDPTVVADELAKARAAIGR